MKGRKQAVLMLVVFALLFVLIFRFFFVVRDVNISGADRPDRDTVIRAANISFGESIFTVDRQAAKEGVDALGVIELMQLRLRLPGTVTLLTRERGREAMLLYGGKIVILDEQAYVVELLDDVPDRDMIYVSGFRSVSSQPGKVFGGEEEQLAAYISVIQALKARGADVYVSEINLEDPENMQLITRAGTGVKLGNAENMDKKIAWMKAIVLDLERRGETGGVLDVSSGTKADYRAPGI